jgi:predicted transcriptional regulator YheO
MIRSSMAAGASSIRIHVGPDIEMLNVAPLHDALGNMIRAAERDLGANSDQWSRAEKQQVVRMLDERGAFLLRGAVDDMARIMGVSRITIYNYLNAIDRS